MQDKDLREEKAENIKQRILMEEGWFIPTLHDKYLQKDVTEVS
jgi:hypothetical protein